MSSRVKRRLSGDTKGGSVTELAKLKWQLINIVKNVEQTLLGKKK